MLKILVFLFSNILAASAFSFQVDTLYYNGTIWTGVAQNKIMSVMAVKDGIIKYVGNEVPAQLRAERTVDLKGKFLMHGFIDTP